MGAPENRPYIHVYACDLLQAALVECPNVINATKCNKVLNVITFFLKYNKFLKTVECLRPRISDIIESNIDKLTTWPSLTSVQFFAAELFFKMCNRNL